MSKITAEHLARQAVVYVRQSTQDQLQHNHESRRRQYGLVDRARELGWAEPMVIDDDLGRSGSSTPFPCVRPRTHNFKPADLRHLHAGRSTGTGHTEASGHRPSLPPAGRAGRSAITGQYCPWSRTQVRIWAQPRT